MINKKKKILSNKQKLQIIAHLKVFCNLLTKLQRRIWKYLQSFQASGKKLFMRVAVIAKECRCCERTVQYALKLFTKMKWLTREFSSYQTTRYHLEPIYCLEKLTSIKRCEEIIEQLSENEDDGPPSRKDLPSTEEVFSERILHPNCTIPVLSNTTMNIHYELGHKAIKHEQHSHQLKKVNGIQEIDYWKFDRFSEHVMQKAFQSADYFYKQEMKKGNFVENLTNFLLKQCWHHYRTTIR